MASPDDTEERFAFRFDHRYQLASAVFGVTPATAWVRVTPAELQARFGPWSLRTPLANVAATTPTGPYGLWRTMGPARMSFADRGATFATNPDAGLCISFHQPQPILLPGGLVKSPALTVTVAEVDRLRAVLGV